MEGAYTGGTSACSGRNIQGLCGKALKQLRFVMMQSDIGWNGEMRFKGDRHMRTLATHKSCMSRLPQRRDCRWNGALTVRAQSLHHHNCNHVFAASGRARSMCWQRPPVPVAFKPDFPGPSLSTTASSGCAGSTFVHAFNVLVVPPV